MGACSNDPAVFKKMGYSKSYSHVIRFLTSHEYICRKKTVEMSRSEQEAADLPLNGWELYFLH